MTALYICSYLFPFINAKGAITGLLTGIFGELTLFYLYFYLTPFRFHHFPKPCLNWTSIQYSQILSDYKFTELNFLPTVLQMLPDKAQKLPVILGEIPVAWYPLVTFLVSN